MRSGLQKIKSNHLLKKCLLALFGTSIIALTFKIIFSLLGVSYDIIFQNINLIAALFISIFVLILTAIGSVEIVCILLLSNDLSITKKKLFLISFCALLGYNLPGILLDKSQLSDLIEVSIESLIAGIYILFKSYKKSNL